MIKLGYIENKITLDSLKAIYTQDLNNGEFLEIETKNEGAGVYFQITTEGFCFNTIEELTEVLQDFSAKIEEVKESDYKELNDEQ